MSRLNKLLEDGEKDICDTIGRDVSSKGEGVYKTLHRVIPCRNCDSCVLNVPYINLREIVDE